MIEYSDLFLFYLSMLDEPGKQFPEKMDHEKILTFEIF